MGSDKAKTSAVGDADDKYAKIRRQQSKFRRLVCLTFLFLVAVGVIMSGKTLQETEEIIIKAEHTAGRAAGKFINNIKERERRFVRAEGGAGEGAADTAAAGLGGDVHTQRDLRPVAPEVAEHAVAQAELQRVVIDETELATEVERLDYEVRRIKRSLLEGQFMETDPRALDATKALQSATRRLLAARYGPEEPYRVKVVLQFQDTIPDFAENGPDGEILIELAPSSLLPHSIFSFLEIARNWKGGAFHRIVRHVLQVSVGGKNGRSLAFQEYSPEFPHVERTVGYAGRPSGPAWYISIQNNAQNHGPGSQQKMNPHEADSCFGKVIKGYDDVVQRIRKVPGRDFISDRKKHVLIKKMVVMVPGKGPGAGDGYVEWKLRSGAGAVATA